MDELIRPATLDDVDAIAHVHVTCWRQAFTGLVPDELQAELDHDARAEMWHRILTAGSGTTLVTPAHGPVTGFVAVGPSPDREDPGHGELFAIYLLKNRWGTGHGHALHQAGVRRLAEQGYVVAHLWSLAENRRANDFYHRHGWRTDGRRRVDPDHPQVTHIGLSRPLDVIQRDPLVESVDRISS